MVLFIQRVAGCLLFTLVILPAQYKDPINMIMSYPSQIIKRVNVYDLIVLDWGVFCHSQKLRIPGTEDMEKEYKDYMFHVRGACIGIVLGLVVALLSGGIIHLMSAI